MEMRERLREAQKQIDEVSDTYEIDSEKFEELTLILIAYSNAIIQNNSELERVTKRNLDSTLNEIKLGKRRDELFKIQYVVQKEYFE